MEILKPLVTGDEMISLFKKSRLSETDVFKAASFTPYTLAERLRDLTKEELGEVCMLEAKNIYRMLHTAGMLLGVSPSDKPLLQQIVSTDFVQNFLQECETINTTGLSTGSLKFAMLSQFLLSECNPQAELDPKFVGKMPPKPLSSLQTTAEEWYRNYVTASISRTTLILDKAGADEAFRYVTLSIAWYMNKSQPFRFHRKPADKDDNDTLFRILIEFIDYVDGSGHYASASTAISSAEGVITTGSPS